MLSYLNQYLDCNGIENGVAVIDSCGDCQLAYIYNYVSHDVECLDDTTGITLVGTTMLVMPEDDGHVYCNSGCITSVVYDCNGIENGVAVVDSCGDCQQAYIYDYVSHDVEYLDDTTGITLVGTTMLVMPEDVGNPYWNAGCISAVVYDCNGIENGVAVVDSCGDCHQSYIYDFVSHIPTFINDTTGLVLGATEMLILAGSPDDIASNPNWNAGCK